MQNSPVGLEICLLVGIQIADIKNMNNLNTDNWCAALKKLTNGKKAQIGNSVWRHPFALNEDSDGFLVSFQRDLWFYAVLLFGIICIIPLLGSICLSFHSIMVDDFEPFMHMFDMFLNGAKAMLVKAICKYIRDAWRTVRFDTARQQFCVKTSIKNWQLVPTQYFNLSDFEGVEIIPVGSEDFQPCGTTSRDEQGYEVALKLKEGKTLTLIPVIYSANKARQAAAQIYDITRLQLLSNACLLVDKP